MLLTDAELVELTRRRKPGWQARALHRMGIPYRRRPDGTLAVLRIHVETPPAADPATIQPSPKLRLEA
jgi:hypothetical protein